MTKPPLVLAVLLSLAACSLQRIPLSCEIAKVDPHTSTDMRDDRYCEILFMHAAGPLATGCVYTTYGLNKCPPAKWETLDPKKLVREYQVDQVIMNGPRFWVMDRFTIDTQGSPTLIDGLEMKPGASIDMPPGALLAGHAQRPYAETPIVRNLCEVAKWQEIFFLWRPALRDPNDDLVLELAVAAGCGKIITHNVRDFEGSQRFGVKVTTPSMFLKNL